MDPHGAVGYQAATRYRRKFGSDDHLIILETAHPAKFADTVKEALDMDIEIPERLARVMDKKKKAEKISTSFDEFKSCLIEKYI
jgi:threonine synthase